MRIIGNEESVYIRSERCPQCAVQGRDQRADNLAIYSDGHAHCFSCKFYDKQYAPRILDGASRSYARGSTTAYGSIEEASRSRQIPGVSQIRVGEALRWLKGYGVTSKEIEAYGIEIAEDSVTFSFKREDGTVVRQQRWFLPDGRRKFKTMGSAGPTRIASGLQESTTVIIVEDAVSAVLVGRQYKAYSLLGSNMPDKALRSLCERFYRVGMWWDSDKLSEALKTAFKGLQWNPNCRVIRSTLDPKDYNDVEIKHFVDISFESVKEREL